MPKAPPRENKGTGPAALVEVGELLRTTREEQGRSIEDVAQSLRLSGDYVRAMEEGAFEKLPGLVFMVGFVRNYADLLELPSEPVARTVRRACALFERDHRLEGAPVLPERNFPAVAVIGISALVLGGLYLGWQHYGGLPSGIVVSGEPAPGDEFPAAVEEGDPGTPPEASAQDPDDPAAAPGSEPSTDADGEGVTAVAALDSVIVIRADEECWIQVERSDGSVVENRILQAGETYAVPPEPGLLLVAGNAGGITLAVAGEALPPIGEAGETVRDVLLEPDALLARFR